MEEVLERISWGERVLRERLEISRDDVSCAVNTNMGGCFGFGDLRIEEFVDKDEIVKLTSLSPMRVLSAASNSISSSLPLWLSCT
jgi:hypothetical protein